MRFNKKYKRGIFLLFLLLLISTSISFIKFNPKNYRINNNSVFLSAPEDNYEENDDIYSAYDIRTLEALWLSSHNGNGTQWDDDWYIIFLDPGEERLRVELLFSHSAGNIDIEVYRLVDSSYSKVAGSYSMNDNEYLELDIFPSGDYYLRVNGSNQGNTYDLWWEDLMPHDDWMEPNDNFGDAREIYPNYYFGLKIIGENEDWFWLYLDWGDTINVSIYFDNMMGNLELELWDPHNTSRIGSYTNREYESILYTADMSGDWRIHVYQVNGNFEIGYDMDIWVYPGDDWMEENDDYWSARWVDAKYYPNLRIKEYDEDWFRTYLNPDDTIEIRIFFKNYEGDLQLELYDPNDPNNPRAESYNDWDDENIFFTADITGDWCFRVYRVSGDYNMVVPYHMEVWINGMMEGDDPYEPNNKPEGAYDLRDYERNWLSKIHGLAVQGDEDWYLIDVTPGFQHLVVNLTFNPFQGYINIELYRVIDRHSLDWNPVYSNYSITGENRAVINYQYIDPGMYMLQVRGDFTGVEYNMWWDDIRTDLRSDDNYEENDDALNGYDLSFHEHEGLWMISGLAILNDSDWYRIQVDPGFEHLFVLVTYDYQEGPIGIEIYNGGYSKVTSNFTMKDNDYISYVLPSNGTYYIRIFGDYDKRNIYNLRWDTNPPSTEEMIPGYDLFILLGALFGVVVIFILKWKRNKNQQ